VYTDDERAAIAYADAMTATPSEVTEQQVADLERRFGRAGVLELTYQIDLENMRARGNSALGITEQGFGSGGTCRVPWTDRTAAGQGAVRRDGESRRPYRPAVGEKRLPNHD
jgi:hypothetical protein